MPVDALLSLQSTVTKTATFSGAALILPGGTPRRGLKARVFYGAAANATGANAVQFSIDVSYDGGVTWNSDFLAPAINLTTTAQSGELAIPFEVSPTSVVNQIQIRLTSLFGGAGTVPTVTYSSDGVMLSRP